jgi:hypothetical protein
MIPKILPLFFLALTTISGRSENPPEPSASTTPEVTQQKIAAPDFSRFSKARIRFPAAANIIDVTASPYHVDKSGNPASAAANTEALNRAVAAAKGRKNRGTLYFPDGIYYLAGTVAITADDPSKNDNAEVTFQGESRDGTILRLIDKAPGFDNPAIPRPILSTFEEGKSYSWTNTAFCNNVFNLTIESGVGNPGAIGLRFYGNNQAGVRDVLIRSGDPERTGWAGIDMATYKMSGPALLKRVEIEGFDHAIRYDHDEYSMVAEDLIIRGQRVGGILNNKNAFSIRRLFSANSVTAIDNLQADGFVVLLDSTLTGGATDAFAIRNAGHFFARNVTTTGYAAALFDHGKSTEKADIEEFVAGPTVSLFEGSRKTSLNLPVEETPEIPWDAPETWISVAEFGATPNDPSDDDAPAFQKAMDAATAEKRTVYFPNGTYHLRGPVTVGGHVRHVIGLMAELVVMPQLRDQDIGVFRLVDGSEPVLVMERIYVAPVNQANRKAHVFQNERSGDTVIKNVFVFGGQVYDGSKAAGKTFLEDICGLRGGVENPIPEAQAQFRFGSGPTWARQLNPESPLDHVSVAGGSLWVLGFKTEQRGTMLAATDGARVEILGGMVLSRKDVSPDVPAFLIENSSATIVVPESTHDTFTFPIVIRETRGGETRELKNDGSAPRMSNGLDFVLPFYTGGAEAQP